MHLLSNMVSNIRVGSNAKKLHVKVQNSKLCSKVLDILYKLGYIRGFILEDRKKILVLLKYSNNRPVIRDIRTISTPGRRMYMRYKRSLRISNNKDSGLFILSTNKGLLTDQESSMLMVGGEVLVKVS
jgi:small subunit ribosomal protein S8